MTHVKDEHLRFQCDKCKFVADGMNKLDSHKKAKHEDIGFESEVVRIRVSITDEFREAEMRDKMKECQ